ncbi:MAG: short chain dehydrogenase [Desulfobacterales bacterium]|nr:short chain dehydrogenase [Desulfobacterales bacterium]
MKIAVIGATGTIGKAVAGLLSNRRHDVISVSRSTRPGVNIDDPASIDAFYSALDEVDALVCAAGSAAFGHLSDLTDEQVRLGIDSKLMGQVNLVRKGMAALRPGGVFVLTGGMLAYSPWPGTAAVALVNAGLEGFVRAAALDLEQGRRIVVVHPPLVAETAAAMGMDPAPWPAASAVAEAYLIALEGKLTGKPVFVAGYGPT